MVEFYCMVAGDEGRKDDCAFFIHPENAMGFGTLAVKESVAALKSLGVLLLPTSTHILVYAHNRPTFNSRRWMHVQSFLTLVRDRGRGKSR